MHLTSVTYAGNLHEGQNNLHTPAQITQVEPLTALVIVFVVSLEKDRIEELKRLKKEWMKQVGRAAGEKVKSE